MKAIRLQRLFSAARRASVEAVPAGVPPWFAGRVVNHWLAERANRERDDWLRVSRPAAAFATLIMLASLFANREVFRSSASPELAVSGTVVQCILPQ